MAVPTISTITPSSGLTRGRNMVRIAGTGFRVAPAPPAGLITDFTPITTVEVYFGGVQSDYAQVVSTTEVIAVVPKWTGDPHPADALPAALDVRLVNLDDAGAPIVGEEVTAAAAYTVDRPKLTNKTVVERVLEEFVTELRRHVHPNVWITMERFYYDSADDIPDRIKKGKLPIIHVNGVEYETDPLTQLMGDQPFVDSVDTDLYHIQRVPKTVDLILPAIEAYSTSEHAAELIGISQALELMFHDIPYLEVSPDSGDTEATGNYKHPMEMPPDGEPAFDLGPEIDGLKSFRAAARIKTVDLIEPGGTEVSREHVVDEPEVDL